MTPFFLPEARILPGNDTQGQDVSAGADLGDYRLTVVSTANRRAGQAVAQLARSRLPGHGCHDPKKGPQKGPRRPTRVRSYVSQRERGLDHQTTR
jgi:hypothetical protein